MSSTRKQINFIEKSKSSDLEGTPSSGIPRLHKGDDEPALEYRKFLQREDEKDLEKIKQGTYEFDAEKWEPRVKSKYRLPLATPLSAVDIQGSVKIAIIIPFRDLEPSKTRTKELNKLTEYMASYLAGQTYKIFVVEQSQDGLKFNRGQLLNIGFEIASKEGYNNFVFHDVDLLPSPELKKYYTTIPIDEPVHIAATWGRYGKNPDYFGGIVTFNKDMFNKINGYPNNFWGWGGEDDELYKRTKKFFDIKKVHEGSIKDLEDLTLQQKLDFLKENELKFMKKKEALAQHEATWKKNGLNNLDYKILSLKKCGVKCELFEVELQVTEDVEQISAPGQALVVPQDLFGEVMQPIQEEVGEKKLLKPQAFNSLVDKYFSLSPFIKSKKNYELEVRFGTKGIKVFTKNDYDNVVKFLKSFGFTTTNATGLSSLRIKCEFIDSVTGKFKMSDIRTEINGLHNIENYCKNNDIKSIYKSEPLSIIYTSRLSSFSRH